jgi:hypothetical protein
MRVTRFLLCEPDYRNIPEIVLMSWFRTGWKKLPDFSTKTNLSPGFKIHLGKNKRNTRSELTPSIITKTLCQCFAAPARQKSSRVQPCATPSR